VQIFSPICGLALCPVVTIAVQSQVQSHLSICAFVACAFEVLLKKKKIPFQTNVSIDGRTGKENVGYYTMNAIQP
jgi:hypothetical protein